MAPPSPIYRSTPLRDPVEPITTQQPIQLLIPPLPSLLELCAPYQWTEVGQEGVYQPVAFGGALADPAPGDGGSVDRFALASPVSTSPEMRRHPHGYGSPTTPTLGYATRGSPLSSISDRSSPQGSVMPQIVLPPLKVIVVGDPSVGKTAFIASHPEATVAIREKDIGMHKVSITTIAYASNKGSCQFDLWDLPNTQPPLGPASLPSEFLKSAKCAVVVYDVTNPKSYSSIFGWRQALLAASSNLPMVLCANKVDSPSRQEELMLASVPGFGQHGFAKAFLISAQEAANTVRPMAWLARETYHDDDFHFIGPPDPADEISA